MIREKCTFLYKGLTNFCARNIVLHHGRHLLPFYANPFGIYVWQAAFTCFIVLLVFHNEVLFHFMKY